MRTIKFRGFNAKNNQWLYGSHIINRGKHFVAPDEFADDKTWEDYEVKPATVGQFTGLTDKNGKEIYDGDIIQHRDVKVIVEFYRGAFGYTRLIQHRVRIAPGASNVVQEPVFIPFIGSDDNKNALRFPDGTYFDTDYCKVVGNVYDNPDMIEEGGEV